MYKIYFSPKREASLNLALEDYLFQNFKDDSLSGLILLYVNEPCFVLGKNQNAYQEVDWLEAARHNLPLYRRISGGGAVFHDSGNLNFSFIVPREANLIANFGPLLEPVQDFLADLVGNCELQHSSDLWLARHKISGNAQALGKMALLQHGTLLYSTDLTAIEDYLHHASLGFESKAIASRQSQVLNIAAQIRALKKQEPPSFEVFTRAFYQFLQERFAAQPLELSAVEYEEIAKLATFKYASWEWNMARSANFTLRRCWQGRDIRIEVLQGRIIKLQVEDNILPQWSQALIQKNLSYNNLRAEVESWQADCQALGIEARGNQVLNLYQEFLSCLFKHK